jgi:hypothetical protein
MSTIKITQKDYDKLTKKTKIISIQDIIVYDNKTYNRNNTHVANIVFENVMSRKNDYISINDKYRDLIRIELKNSNISRIDINSVKGISLYNSEIGSLLINNVSLLDIFKSNISYLSIFKSIVKISFMNQNKIKDLKLYSCLCDIRNERDTILDKIFMKNSYFIDGYGIKELLNKAEKSGNCGNDLYSIVPEVGSFVGFKKATTFCGEFSNPVIIKLEIQEDSLRSSACGRKCRASKVKVLDIYDINNKNIKYKTAYSRFMSLSRDALEYKVGEIVESHDFKMDRWIECAPGIHFFITEEEAINYEF